ncbi:MAG: putative glycoside hydrolase, partial [Gaiellaceae bacterium]
TGDDTSAGSRATENPKKAPVRPRPLPAEVRGVHVTLALASDADKIDEFLAMPGLNTIQIDIKDENGEVGFLMPATTLARRIGASKRYYRAGPLAAKTRANGVYLVGRIVVFEDPILAVERPDLAIRTPGGGVWTNNVGLGWVNPYDKRVWDYNVEIATAAARAGFDEIQFDYVRFPSDGDVESAVYRGKVNEDPGWTIARFVQYAAKKLKPLGVRVSVDVFGLSATHDLGIGQRPRRFARFVDAIYPMVYPSHYNPGEFNLPDPSAAPGLTVAASLQDFRRQLRGTKTMLIPWLEDFSLGRTRTPEEVQAQIQAARDYRAKGFLLWNPSGIYTQEALRSP